MEGVEGVEDRGMTGLSAGPSQIPLHTSLERIEALASGIKAAIEARFAQELLPRDPRRGGARRRKTNPGNCSPRAYSKHFISFERRRKRRERSQVSASSSRESTSDVAAVKIFDGRN